MKQDTPQFKCDAEKLNLQLDETYRIYIYKDRIKGDYTIYILSNTFMIKKLVAHPYLKAFQRGIGFTIAEIKERFWIPKITSAQKTRNSQVFWMRKLLGSIMPSHNSWRSISWSYKWLKTILNDCYWFCWTISLHKETKVWRKNLCSFVQFPFNTSSICGPNEILEAWRILDQSTATDCLQTKTKKGLFRQLFNIFSSF